MYIYLSLSLSLFLFLCACGERVYEPAPFRQYGISTQTIQVTRGDSVAKLAKKYGIPIQTLITTNHLKSPYRLYVGQPLIIEGGKHIPFDVTMNELEKPSKPTISMEEIPVHVTPTPEADHAGPDIAPGADPFQPPKGPLIDDPVMPIPDIPLKTTKKAIKKEEVNKKDIKSQKTKPQETKSQETKSQKTKAQESKTQPEKAVLEKKPLEKKSDSKEKNTGQEKAQKKDKPSKQAPKTALSFKWPTHGDIIRTYKRGKNDGINIQAPEGTPVFAAEEGTVAYVGDKLPGFGNLIMIKHKNGWMTAYAHTKNVTVTRDTMVKRGEKIAQVGQTGNVNSPQLHFEIRKRSQAVDPKPLLE